MDWLSQVKILESNVGFTPFFELLDVRSWIIIPNYEKRFGKIFSESSLFSNFLLWTATFHWITGFCCIFISFLFWVVLPLLVSHAFSGVRMAGAMEVKSKFINT